jgi:hypothetical protein
MTWNHRVIKYVMDGPEPPTYAFVEMFYDEDGKMTGFTDPFTTGESLEEMTGLVARLDAATKHPIVLVDENGDILGEENEPR